MRNSLKVIIGLVFLTALLGAILVVQNNREENAKRVLDATITLEQGIDAFEAQDFSRSLELLESIEEGVINDWRIPYYKGRALIQEKDYERAATELEKAFALNKQVERIPFALGVVYFKLGNLSLSKGYFHATLQINPANEEAKGLMDKVAALERIQPGEAEAETRADDYSGPNAHPPMPATPGPQAQDKNSES